ncbi:DUF2334 domain-containing protein, partial [candidate division KSB1 bacterium]
GHSCQNEQKNNIKQFIMLKADDLGFDKTHTISPGWQKFINYIENMKIKASIGIVGNSLEKGDDKYISLIKSIHSKGNIEFWNHGYNHYQSYRGSKRPENPIWEFKNSPYEQQYESILKTQELAKTKLNITINTFGAPYNFIDKNTLKAIENNTKDIKVWLFGDTTSTKLVLRRYCDIEFPAHRPDYQKFLVRYNSRGKGREYLVLQVHPNSYDDKRFNQFEQVINFLIKQGAIFITPFEYYQMVNKNK